MSNNVMFYNPVFYAQEALMVLEKSLGLAGRVYRAYEPTPQQKGNVINISKPGTFTVQDAPSVAQDVNTTGIAITLDQWKEVKFQLTDKELTFTKEKIIQDHIQPAAYAISDYIDQQLAGLYKDIYGFAGVPGTSPGASTTGPNAGLRAITGCRKAMNNAMIPDDGRRHWMIDANAEEEFLNLSVFNSNPASTATGTDIVNRGHLRNVFGLEIFSSLNTPYHNKGSMVASANIALQAGVTKGATVADLRFTGGVGQAIFKDSAGTSLTGTMAHGDIFTVAGDAQTYVVLDDTPATGNQAIVKFYPAPQQTWAANAVVTVKPSHENNVAFHQNAFTLACAPLSEIGTSLGGCQVASISRDALSVRSRLWYDPDASKVVVALDILFGIKTLQPELAMRYAG